MRIVKDKDTEHLFRLLLVFLVGTAVLLFVRSLLMPQSFGQYGHFRGNALTEIRALPVAFAGHQSCEECHSDVLDLKKTGKHARVTCETCHGALASHADDPASVQPEKLRIETLCVRCHEASSAKPKGFPQVASEEHAGGVPCDTCHQPHSPVVVESGGKK